ncbi:uncharacterized protein B0I36DRAFT_310685 [Microdochium trichocladiopsis]|uniref:Gastric mucin-like protein n=1 Tax=Microdochium trichocladiopsis TaxID=1682393 RepID=A0A9P9BVM5_9PEZI|nr:uncharacterized protein B0I36DRAFT_310685 [Microdochium trichocladiopsis]KAH7040438.1 hypothetical protein B0I36DRAFT_310685 [Microdochium trichocladiopsis]
MKAADALDRETESLQPSNELDLTSATTRPRSMSLPIGRFPDDFENAPPFYVFGASANSSSLILPDMQKMIARDLELIDLCERSDSREARSTALRALQSLEKRLGTNEMEPQTPNCIGEPYYSTSRNKDGALWTPATGYGSLPATPAVVMSAQIIDVRCSEAAACSSHRRVRSVDRVYATARRNQDISLCRDSKSEPVSKRTSQPAADTSPKTEARPVLRSKFYSEIPRASFCKPTQTTIKRSAPSHLSLSRVRSRPVSYNDTCTTTALTYMNQSTETERNYVDRGVDAIEPHLLDLQFEKSHNLPLDAPFEVVLPMIEDLVIHFKSEKYDAVLDAMLTGLQDGTYPVSLPPLMPENDEDLDSSRSSTSSHGSIRPTSDVEYCGVSTSTVPTSVYPVDADDYDPYASHGDYLRHTDSPFGNRRATMDKNDTPLQATSMATKASRPTAAPEPSTPVEKSFHAFQTNDCRNAVGVQNSLRSILSIYFPPQDGGLNHLKFSSLPEMGGMWQPVFRDGDSDGSQPRSTNIDLILAIGAQKGVERSFLSAISGSLEKLGSKSNGITHSGRLDLRYLIASAMQTFTAQPLANQTTDNPFTNSLLLATLIIPFLEMYLAAHADTRFLLLEYPPEHLTTVLALQRLIGVDLLKVSGIIDAEAGEPKPFSGFKAQSQLRPRHSAAQSVSCMSDASTTSVATTATLLSPGPRKSEAPSFSKANFLLTSSATESEIATLISTIWKLLVDISPFYIPEGAPKSHAARRVIEQRQVKRVPSDLYPRLPTPLIESTVQYAPLAAATAMMGFAAADNDADSVFQSTSPQAVASPTTPLSPIDNFAAAAAERRPPTPPVRSSRASITETIRSSKTMRTMASQRNKIRNIMLGRDIEVELPVPSRPETMSGSFFDLSDDEDGRFAADERKYMPLFGRTPVVRKGNSRKALMWLGLSVEQ